MNLDDAQKKQVADWISAGLKLAEIQTKLSSEWGLRLTYIEVRLLVDELKLVPKDIEPTKPLPTIGKVPETKTAAPDTRNIASTPNEPTAPRSGVSVTVDQVSRPGALASGSVTFSDGQSAAWYLDELGRLGLVPKQKNYRPSAPDVEQFQSALEKEMGRLGL